jgi:hypothetical protein
LLGTRHANRAGGSASSDALSRRSGDARQHCHVLSGEPLDRSISLLAVFESARAARTAGNRASLVAIRQVGRTSTTRRNQMGEPGVAWSFGIGDVQASPTAASDDPFRFRRPCGGDCVGENPMAPSNGRLDIGHRRPCRSAGLVAPASGAGSV